MYVSTYIATFRCCSQFFFHAIIAGKGVKELTNQSNKCQTLIDPRVPSQYREWTQIYYFILWTEEAKLDIFNVVADYV